MATLAEIRAKLKAQETRSERTGGGDNAIFPHWNIPEGSTSVLRFLPDSDESNTFFWKERLMIKLPFLSWILWICVLMNLLLSLGILVELSNAS